MGKKAKKQTKKSAKKARSISCLGIISAVLLFVVVIAGVLSAVIVVSVIQYAGEMPPMVDAPIPAPKKTTKIYTSNGELLANLYIENREYTHLNEIPEMLQLAIIAIEDERFFFHHGVDFVGLTRAAWVNFRRGSTAQGASTITQQLARNIYLTPERTIPRKLREMKISLALERKYSKEEILERYLNQINFGHGAYGAKTAALAFFGKQPKELTIAECALLAATPKAPSIYSPYRNMDKALARRNLVLDKMLQLNFITREQYETAISEKINLKPLSGPGYENYRAPYFVTYVADLLTDRSGPFQFSPTNLHTEGYRIYTTLDAGMQKAAEEAVKYGMKLVRDMHANISQAAIVAMEPHTGKIYAMVGGVDYSRSKFNRAWQAKRQPGSAFKPYVYITALKEGYSMDSIVSDSPVCYPSFPKKYCPHNYDNKYSGGMTFCSALYYSRNVPAVKIGHLVGPKNVIETATEMGLEGPFQENLSLALGSSEATPLEMATAYSVIANGGYRIEPVAIEKITDDAGNVIYEKTYDRGKRVLDDNVIARIVPCMEAVIKRGTGRRADIGRPAAGKTGTTSDWKDAWFIGFTPQLTAAVWIGNDNNSFLRVLVNGKPTGKGIAGGTIPAPMWKYFMERALKGKEAADFDLPEPTPMAAKSTRAPDAATGTAAPEETPESVEESPPLEYREPEVLLFQDETQEMRQEEPELIEPEPENFF
ncbi:MAG: penicillin-binding protein 1A [bacterium]